MEVTVNGRIDKCCDSDSARYALGCAQLVPDIGDENRVFVVATDSRQLVVVHADGFADQDYLIPRDALPSKKPDLGATVTSADGKRFVRTVTKKGGQQTSTVVEQDSAPGRFPNIVSVLPEIDNRFLKIAIDPQHLLAQAEALRLHDEHRYLTLFVRVPDQFLESDERQLRDAKVDTAIHVLGPDGIGVVMPMAGGEPDAEAEEFNTLRKRFVESRSKHHSTSTPSPEPEPEEDEEEPEEEESVAEAPAEVDPLAALMSM